MDLSAAIWTPHALEQVAARGIQREAVEAALRAPSTIYEIRVGRVVATYPAEIDGKSHLVRIFVDIDRTPPEIVTAYRTSKIRKYGGQQ